MADLIVSQPIDNLLASSTIEEVQAILEITDISTLSANWESTYTQVLTARPSWDTAYTLVQSGSGTWGSGGPGGGSDVSTLSSNWQDTYTIMGSSSANWNSTYTTVQSLSPTWGVGGSDDTVVNTKVRASSANWDDTYTIVQGHSATWDLNTSNDAVNSTVQSTSANWILNGGNTTSASLSVGTKTSQALVIQTNNLPRLRIENDGTINTDNNVNIGGSLYASGALGLSVDNGTTLRGSFNDLGTSASTGTMNIASGSTINSGTKTINFGTGGLAGSNTVITVGTNSGGSTNTRMYGNVNVTTLSAQNYLGIPTGGSDVSGLSSNWEDTYVTVRTLSTGWGVGSAVLNITPVTTNYTIKDTDIGGMISYTGNTPITAFVTTNINTGGYNTTVAQLSTGTITIALSSNYSTASLISYGNLYETGGQGATASIVRAENNIFLITGLLQ